MRKLILTVFVTACAFTAHSQDKKFRFGAKAGVNFATFSGDIEDAKTKVGFHIGVLAEYAFTENLSIQPELLYSTQGTKGEYAGIDDGLIYEGEFTDKVTYINLPILVKYNNLGTKGLSIGVGPQIGFLLSADEEYDETFDGETDSGEFDWKDNAKSIDVGVVLGVGYEIDMGAFVEARYNLGLTNVNDAEDADDFEFKNSVFQVSVGYKF